MRKKHEKINGHPISCWDDNNTHYPDIYTVVYLETLQGTKVQAFGMDSNPNHPQGIGYHITMDIDGVNSWRYGGNLGKRISYASLPEGCKKAIQRDFENMEEIKSWDEYGRKI
jgi:hypothetical protein